MNFPWIFLGAVLCKIKINFVSELDYLHVELVEKAFIETRGVINDAKAIFLIQFGLIW